MKKRHLILFLIALLTIQCRKDRKKPFCEEFPQDCVDIMTVKDHFYFDVGTYWIYEEETSGQLDSQWVSKSITNKNESWFDYEIESSIILHHYHIWLLLLSELDITGLVPKDETSAYVERSKTMAGDFVGTSYISIFYPQIGDSIYNFGGELKIIDKKFKFELKDIEYENVLVIKESKNKVENKQSTKHYYAEHVGLIRKELIDSNEVWNLIRYNIVQ